VRDVASVMSFYVSHFGYQVVLHHEGMFAKLRHENGHELFFLQCGAQISSGELGETVDARPSTGVTIALEVEDAAAELARLERAGVAITAPLLDEPWGERLFQVKDPAGTTVQLLQWLSPEAAQGVNPSG
jgi:uncharacterized glyoxalase superfamily protein PhnB